jgi:hypothetical protein
VARDRMSWLCMMDSTVRERKGRSMIAIAEIMKPTGKDEGFLASFYARNYFPNGIPPASTKNIKWSTSLGKYENLEKLACVHCIKIDMIKWTTFLFSPYKIS